MSKLVCVRCGEPATVQTKTTPKLAFCGDECYVAHIGGNVSEEIVHDNVNELVISGSGQFSMKADGSLVSRESKLIIEQKGNQLHINVMDGGSVIMGRGGTVTNYGPVVGQSNYGGVVSFHSSGGFGMHGGVITHGKHSSASIMLNGHKIELRGDTLYMDGVKMVPEHKAGSRQGEDTEDDTRKDAIQVHKLNPSTCRIDKVYIDGDVFFYGVLKSFVPESGNFAANIRGSGRLYLPPDYTFNKVNLRVQGSGKILGSDQNTTKARHAVMTMQGSGAIQNVVILESGVLTVLGSGKISASKTGDAQVVKENTGSGSIRVADL